MHSWSETYLRFSFFFFFDIPEGTCKQDTELTALINNVYNNPQKCSPCVLAVFAFLCVFFVPFAVQTTHWQA